MQPLNVVIAQEDCVRAEHLAIALHPHFRNVSIARDLEELRRNTARNRAALAVVDLELISMDELATFCKEFPGVAVVCTHRVPDESMWMQILAVGAIDCCHTLDVRVIVEAARGKARLANAKAA
jgi:DNA-binding NarL/FixJ family response regulator